MKCFIWKSNIRIIIIIICFLVIIKALKCSNKKKSEQCLICKREEESKRSTFCGWSASRQRLAGQFSKEWEIRETCLMVLWPSWQFYSGGVWKSHRKEVQKTEHNPKKTQQNAISPDNKRGKGDGVGRRGDSMEMLSVPDSKRRKRRGEEGRKRQMRRGRRTWSLQGSKARLFLCGKTRNRENVKLKVKEGSNLADRAKERKVEESKIKL